MKYLIRIGLFIGVLLLLLFGFYFYYFTFQVDDYFNKEASSFLVNDENIANSGYDLTEYFTSGKAVKGDDSYKYEYEGVIYLFATEENKSLFIEEAEKFLPQFGGYCAFGLGMEVGDGIGINKPGKYSSTPTSFTILNDKLYLFHESVVFHAKERWEKDKEKFLVNAHKAWKIIENDKGK